MLKQDAQNDFPARPQTQKAPEAYPLGYVEDAFKTRTKLEVIFSILLVAHFWACRIGPLHHQFDAD
jgi:hypothetical protein